ncbi:MAG TPA: TonB-dependent receptor [Polyangiaceae bacterium]
MVGSSRCNDYCRSRYHHSHHAWCDCVIASLLLCDTTVGWASPPTTHAELEVTVRGDRIETTPGGRDPSIASSVVGRSSISGPGLQAQDVLRTQPGVIVTESGGFGAPSTATIRGATATDTPVYLSGVRLNDDVGGTADLSMIPLWLIHHVEIYRGNAPLGADRAGPGGAIYFEPKRPTKRMGGVGYYGGAWGTSRGWAYHGDRYRDLSYLVGVSADRASNRYPFVNDHGTLLVAGERDVELRRNGDERTIDAWALGRAELGRRFVLDWVNNAIEREQGVPRLALLQSLAARQRTRRYLTALTLKGPLDESGNSRIEARLSLLHAQVAFDDRWGELSLGTTQLDIVDWRIEQQIAANVALRDWARLRPIMDVAYETIARRPNDIPLDGTRRTYLRAGAGAEMDVASTLTWRGTAYLECHHTGARSDSPCGTLEPTARLGAEWRATSALHFFANVGRYLRTPTLGELYGVSGVVHGNRQLAAERGETADLGVRAAAHPGQVIRKLYFDVFLFERWAEGLIAYTHTGQGFVTPYNVKDARVQGIEFLLGCRGADVVGVELVGTLMDPRDTSKGQHPVNDVLPFRSRLLLAPRTRLDWKRSSATNVSGAGSVLSATYQSSRYVDPAGLAVIDEQLSVDVEGYVEWFNGLLTARARVADLFDARRTDIVGYPLPGRSVYLGVEAQY